MNRPSRATLRFLLHPPARPGNFKRPRFCRFVEELPFTATGKKMHYKVKQMAIEDQEKGLLERL